MKQTIGLSDFVSAFHSIGRGEQFSREALGFIFDYLKEMEESSGEEIELDVIGFCCDFSEEDFDQIRSSYRDCRELDDDEIVDWLQRETIVVGTTAEGVVFQQF